MTCYGGARGDRVVVVGVVLKVDGDRAQVLFPAPESRGRHDLGICGAAESWLPLDGLRFLALEELMASIEEIEKRRSERRATHDKARLEQEAADLEAIDKLEAEIGEPLITMTSNGFKPGVATKIAFRAPTAAEYKRYADQVGLASKSNDPFARRKAQEMLAACCMLYPAADSDARKALLEASPGTLISLSIEAAKVAELRAEDEGKG